MLQDRVRINNMLFSCTGKGRNDYEPLVEDHAIVYILSGMLTISDGGASTEYRKGNIVFFSKNQLLKTTKVPLDNLAFMSISVFLSRTTLFNYATEQGIVRKGNYTGYPNLLLKPDILLSSFFDSMVPYFEHFERLTQNLIKLKTMELLELLKRESALHNILFNFEDRFKIDLEAYMNKNYMHNIPLTQFAYLTGRSLSTFKRDFQKAFTEAPTKWLIKKRLELAHHLIAAKEKRPSEVYFEAGFVNFSHFSQSFRSVFGMSPSELYYSKNAVSAKPNVAI